MRNSVRVPFILALVGLLAACGRSSQSQLNSEDAAPSYAGWRQERAERDAAHAAYMKSQKDNYASFANTPVGFSGIPLIMFRVFPIVFPDIWNDSEMQKLGFRQRTEAQAILPFGLGWGNGSTPLLDVPALKDISWLKQVPGIQKLPDPKDVRMQVVNLSCAGCHNGRVMVDGQEKYIVGAPTTTFDINAYRRKIVQTLQDPRYTFENFEAAIQQLGVTNIYKEAQYLPHALIDWVAFKAKGATILAAIKDKLLTQESKILDLLGEHSYRSSSHLLKGGARGQTDAFGIGTARILPATITPDLLQEYLPADGSMIDYAAVWTQGKKPFAQWDGSITVPFIRNIAPAIGVIGDPLLVNIQNTRKATDFVYGLPAPAYPFDVDANKATEGAKVFAQACASCHNGSTFMPLAEIGTDAARAAGFMKKTRELLLGDITRACGMNPSIDPACALENPDAILIPTYNRPGYLAPILDGIWARAPYLHNGSIPTLQHLLVPASRPQNFVRGNTAYDQKMVGFVWNQEISNSANFDVNELGWSNQGHADKDVFFGGIDFEQDKVRLEALLEYLKTL